MYTRVHVCINSCASMYTHAHSNTHMYTMHTHVHPLYSCTLLYTPMYTNVHSCTPIMAVHSQIDMYICQTYLRPFQSFTVVLKQSPITLMSVVHPWQVL